MYPDKRTPCILCLSLRQVPHTPPPPLSKDVLPSSPPASPGSLPGLSSPAGGGAPVGQVQTPGTMSGPRF